ncbi:ImcF-related family protein, partial [Peribacillus simplex]
LYQDDLWVLGGAAPQQKSEQTDLAVRQLYVQDYIRQWEQFLSDIQLNSSADLSQRINTARLLSGNHSPLRQLVINLGGLLTLNRA